MEAHDNSRFEAEISGIGADIEDVIATIDNGLEVGALPLRVDDLTQGPHTLELRLTGFDGLRAKPYRCVFNVPANSTDTVTAIQVTKSGKKLKVSGCKRVKDAH